MSWTSAASGLIFVASSMFQAMGNTVPSLISSAVRITMVAALTLILAPMPGFALRWIWYLSVGTVFVQLVLSLGLSAPRVRATTAMGSDRDAALRQ